MRYIDCVYRGHRIGVVIPAYNEAAGLAAVIDEVPRYVDRVFLINDGSADNTSHAALATTRPLTVVHHACNAGVGAALTSGYRAAIADDTDIACVMAGDGQMDPLDLPKLLDAIIDGGADYAKGNRFLSPDVWREMPRHRLCGNIALSIMTKAASGYWKSFDSQCGYTAIRCEMLKQLRLGELYPRYGYPNYLLAMLRAHGAKVVDVPVRPRYGPNWHSGIRVSRAAFTLPVLLAVSWWRRKTRWSRA